MWTSTRYVEDKTTFISAVNGQLRKPSVSIDSGVMVDVFKDGYFAYSGTSDIQTTGIQLATQRALKLIDVLKEGKSPPLQSNFREQQTGNFQSAVLKHIDTSFIHHLCDSAVELSQKLMGDKIATAESHFMVLERTTKYQDSNGSTWEQKLSSVIPALSAIAYHEGESQKRTLDGGFGRCLQGGQELAQISILKEQCEIIKAEAIELLTADNCPSETLDLLLMPSQMNLQIHESIGHPLEYDRILGDERNYAGSSFIKLSDFGNYQYGSELLNIVFDPTVESEFATYKFDDQGTHAKKESLISRGILQRGLGGLESQIRANLPGVACSRVSSWNRPPIDRMANINMVPGDKTLPQMIESIERGLLMDNNRAWSIDDYRLKFQFGCEMASLIVDGKIVKKLKNPNYRSRTDQFWKRLKAVGDSSTFELFGSPFCGKGEPNQIIRVGHASPACLFSGIEVFGG